MIPMMKISNSIRQTIVLLALVWSFSTEYALARSHKSVIEQNKIKLPTLTQQAVRGKAAYGKYCASCHGKNIGGTSKGPTFISRLYHPGHHRDDSFFTAAKRGAFQHHWKFGDMKPVTKISDRQLGDVVNYIRLMQKENGVY